jgi:hypothetical protein
MRHAYGSASDTPFALRRLLAGDAGALSGLWGSVVHQGSTYSASFAAFPYLVKGVAAFDDNETRAEILILSGSIAVGPFQGEPDLSEAFLSAKPQGLSLALAALDTDLDDALAVHLLSAAAALAGHRTLAATLEGFTDGEFLFVCPECEHRFPLLDAIYKNLAPIDE